MDEARDMVALSLPFVAGVATCAFLWSLGSPGPAFAATAASVTLLVTVALALLCIMRSCGIHVYLLLMLATGAFCYCSSMLLPPLHGRVPGMALRAVGRMRDLIDSIPYAHEGSNHLVKALLTGDRSSLGRGVIGTFRASGASHILALSGLHLGIIYALVRRMGSLAGNSPRSRMVRCVATVALTGFYTIMTGAGASCVRAWLFVCLNELASVSPGRRKEPVRVLLASLSIQLALSPAAITGVGFQLSYLAMCGIMLIYPRLRDFYPKSDSWRGKYDPMRWIWNAAALSIACQLFTAPVAWNSFHTFPRYFILTNITALPLSTAAMVASVITLILSASGICPEFVIRVNDTLLTMLVRLLETISQM